jgi:hypothetical protein
MLIFLLHNDKKTHTTMRKLFTILGLCGLVVSANAQTADTTEKFVPHGKLWGYAFGDYANKGGTDEVKRGGSNQYTNIPVNENMFQFRRIYLGYNYEISKKFVAEFLLAAEDDFASGVLGQGNGDILTNTKFSPYVKLANLRWKNIWKGTDLVIGQSPTPTFAQGSALAEYARNTQTSEEVWKYRSIERTITDIRRTSSYDFGAALQGWFDGKGNFGYDVMVANGTGAKPENDPFKWFYGDVYAKFFNKKLVVDLYQDYTKLTWNTTTNGQAQTKTTTNGVTTYANPTPIEHRDRNMSKLFVAWNDKKFTIGAEAFQTTLMGDVAVVGADHKVYYRTTKATGVSVFVRGAIYKDKLGFFARYDMYDPSHNLKNIVNMPNIASYAALTSNYEPTTKEQFVTYGLDFTPIKNVHIMPNVWMNTYKSAVDYSTSTKGLNSNINGTKGTDAVYRITFYYVYGK